MKAKSLFYGIVIGSISAGIATILSAPSSGKETRLKLKRNQEEIMSQIHEIKLDLVNIKNSFTTLSKEGKNSILTFIEEVKVLIEAWKIEVKPHQEQLEKEIQIIQEKLQELEAALPPTT